jgi:hypothetical protein
MSSDALRFSQRTGPKVRSQAVNRLAMLRWRDPADSGIKNVSFLGLRGEAPKGNSWAPPCAPHEDKVGSGQQPW